MASVENVEVARVAVPDDAALPTEPLLRLSALDAQWFAFPLIQRVLLFDGSLPPFASLVGSLRASLTATLARFLPLAGKIVFLPSTGDAAFDCSEEAVAAGVRFVVAESDAGAEQLAGDADHDADAFASLVPELDAGVLPAETLAVQVTRLRGGRAGGLAVGVALHHAVADGRSVWRFLQAWAAACRGDADTAPAPTFDRAAVALPGGEELARSTLRKYAPDLPVLAPMEQIVPGPKLSRRTFTVSAEHIHRLKQRIAGSLTSSSLPSSAPPSSFVVVAALAWVSFVRSKHPAAISAADDVYLFFFIDCRGRRGIDPPVAENYFGTCISGCLARATARDLLAEDDGIALAAAAKAVQEEVRRAAEDPLAGLDWMDLLSWLPLDRLVNMSGSTRFPAYEVADFGWGAPSRTELVTMSHDGQVVLVAAKGGGGAVQASVSLHPDHMDAFKVAFG